MVQEGQAHEKEGAGAQLPSAVLDLLREDLFNGPEAPGAGAPGKRNERDCGQGRSSSQRGPIKPTICSAPSLGHLPEMVRSQQPEATPRTPCSFCVGGKSTQVAGLACPRGRRL